MYNNERQLGAMLTLETGRIYFKMTLYSLLAINLFNFQFSFPGKSFSEKTFAWKTFFIRIGGHVDA